MTRFDGKVATASSRIELLRESPAASHSHQDL